MSGECDICNSTDHTESFHMKTAKAHNAPLMGEIETHIVGGTPKSRREIKKIVHDGAAFYWARQYTELSRKLGIAIGTIEGVLLEDIPPDLKKMLRATLKHLDGQPKE